MKNAVLAFTFLFAGGFAISQSVLPKKIADSLWQNWINENNSDSVRINSLQDYAWDGYLIEQPDSALYFSKLEYAYASQKANKKHMAQALNLQGACYLQKGDYTNSLNYFFQSLDLFNVIGNKKNCGLSLQNIGNAYRLEKDTACAIAYYSRFLEIYTALGNILVITELQNSIGDIYFKEGEQKKAMVYYDRSFDIYRKNGYTQLIADLHNNIGVNYAIQKNVSEALNHYFLSLDAYEKKGLKNDMSRILKNIAEIYQQQGNYTDAINYFKKRLIISENLENKYIKAQTLFGIGYNYSLMKDYTNSIDYFSKSQVVYEELKNYEAVARVLCNSGNIYKEHGDITNAQKSYTNGMALYEKVGDKEVIADLKNGLGNIYLEQGYLAKSLDLHLQGLKIRQNLGIKSDISQSLSNIGIIYYNGGDHANALDCFFQSLKIKELIGDSAGMASTVFNIGNCYSGNGENSNAMLNYNRSIKISRRIGNKNIEGRSLVNIGSIIVREGDSAFNVGNRPFRTEKYSLALDYFNRGLILFEEINERDGMSSVLRSIGTIYKNNNDLLKSKQYFLRALNYAYQLNSPSQIRQVSRKLNQVYCRLNKTDSALFYLDSVKNILERDLQNNYFTLSEHEKQLYFNTLEFNFGLYYEFATLYKNIYPFTVDTSYNIALKTKGITLKSSTAMRTFILNSKDSVLIMDYENWIGFKKKISKLCSGGADTRQLEKECDELEEKLVKKSAAFSEYQKINSLTWKQVQSSLKNDECAIEFVNFQADIDTTFPVSYIALLIKPNTDHPEIIRLCNEEELKKIMTKSSGNNQGFVNSLYGTKEDLENTLYQKLWAPMEAYLKDVKTIYYSPSGLLHKISFASLSKSKNYFLCDMFQLNQVSSTGKIAIAKRVALSNKESYFLMGGINYNTDSTTGSIWPYLPGTLTETKGIARLLKKKKNTILYLQGETATEENLKSHISDATIAHISTHGFFFPDPDELKDKIKTVTQKTEQINFRGSTNYANLSFVNNKNPLMRSGIVLAGANDVWNRKALTGGEDGILTAQEVSNLDMSKTKLVVLSACETGLGDIKGSEGVYGLQRAFKMAGAKYIMMSLWQVPDKETAEFMQLFYKNLVSLKNINTAFQKTQQTMRSRYDPYFWGAFVLVE